MGNKPKIIYLHGCVAKLYNHQVSITESGDETNIGYYHVINGGWNFKYDFNLNQVIEPDNTTLKTIEYSGPFPETDDYNVLINHAQAALLDPSVNDKLKVDTEDPKHFTKTYETNDSYYLVYGFSIRNLLKYSVCEMGFNPYEWSSHQNPVRFSDLNTAKYYADRAPGYLENIQIEHITVHKHIVKTIDSVKIIYEPKKLKQDIPF